jgi:hypothetical protein
MRDPYAQAAMSYAHRASAAAGSFILGGILGVFLLVGAISSASHGGFVLPLCLQLFLFIPLATHVRDQFSYPQACLIPDFRKVHAVIACVAAALVAVVLPTMFTWVAGWWSVGFLAIVLLLFGVVLWLTLLRQVWLSLILFFAVCIGIRPTLAAVHSLTSGQYETGAFMLLALAMAIVVLVGFRLWHLTEESPGYRFSNQTKGVAKAGEEDRGDENGSLRIFWLRTHASLRLIRHARRAATSRWSRVCRWQAEPASWSVPASTLTSIAAIAAWHWFHGTLDISGLWAPIALIACIWPPLLWPAAYTRKASAMSYELLLPVSRSAYLKQLGMAAALSQIESWGILNAMLILWWLSGLQARIPLAGALSVLVISALCQIWFFGITVLLSLAQPRMNPLIVAVSLVSLVPLLTAFVVFRPIGQWQIEVMTLSGVLAFIGVLATKAAYRRWLVADVDW